MFQTMVSIQVKQISPWARVRVLHFFFRHQQPPSPLAAIPVPAVVSDRVRKLICQRLGGLRKLEDSDAKFASEPG